MIVIFNKLQSVPNKQNCVREKERRVEFLSRFNVIENMCCHEQVSKHFTICSTFADFISRRREEEFRVGVLGPEVEEESYREFGIFYINVYMYIYIPVSKTGVIVYT